MLLEHGAHSFEVGVVPGGGTTAAGRRLDFEVDGPNVGFRVGKVLLRKPRFFRVMRVAFQINSCFTH
jgi:hypothetical protein